MNIVFITGPGTPETGELCKRLGNSGLSHLILGDGIEKAVTVEQLKTLADRIGPDTHIIVVAHGLPSEEGLELDLGADMEVGSLIQILQSVNATRLPGHDSASPWRGLIHIVSCFSGAAQKEHAKLAAGSMLMTHSGADVSSLRDFDSARIACLIDHYAQVLKEKKRAPTPLEVFAHCIRSAPDHAQLSTNTLCLAHVLCDEVDTVPQTYIAKEFASFKTLLQQHDAKLLQLGGDAFDQAGLLCDLQNYRDCQFILHARADNVPYVTACVDLMPVQRRNQWLHGTHILGRAATVLKIVAGSQSYLEVVRTITDTYGLPRWLLVPGGEDVLVTAFAIAAMLAYFEPAELDELLGRLDQPDSREFVKLFIAAAKANAKDAAEAFCTDLYDDRASFDRALSGWLAYAKKQHNHAAADVLAGIQELHALLSASTLDLHAIGARIDAHAVVTPHAFAVIERTKNLPLIQRAASSCTDRSWLISLCAACWDGDEAVVSALMKRKDAKLDVASICVGTGHGARRRRASPLQYACVGENIAIVTLLLDQHADVNMVVEGNTPLHTACMVGNLEIVKLLCDKGARRDLVNKDGQTPQQRAAHWKRDAVVSYLETLPPEDKCVVQ